MPGPPAPPRSIETLYVTEAPIRFANGQQINGLIAEGSTVTPKSQLVHAGSVCMKQLPQGEKRPLVIFLKPSAQSVALFGFCLGFGYLPIEAETHPLRKHNIMFLAEMTEQQMLAEPGEPQPVAEAGEVTGILKPTGGRQLHEVMGEFINTR